MAEQIKVPGVLRPGTGSYHSYAKDIIDDQLRNKKQSELNALFNQGKGLDENGNIVPIAGGKAIDADDISYTEKVSPDSHKTGSVGKKVKELEDRINDLVPGEEYVSDTVIDLIDYMLDGSTPQSFTYDSDTKYVYSGKVTTMCTYARNNTSYAAFKVVDIDKYIVYTIYDNTFTYYNELNSETLPNEARSKFELGKYALVKQLEGKTGDSWVDGKVGVFVDSSNRPMSFRYVSSVEIYGQTLNNVLLGKTTDDTNIYVYNLSSGMFKFNNRISSNDPVFETLNTFIVGGGSSGGAIDYNDLINKPIIQKNNENGYVLGNDNSASGTSSIAEGNQTVASGSYSHAEGNDSYAIGDTSHAEGNRMAYGSNSHAEGNKRMGAVLVTRAYISGYTTLYVNAPVPYASNIEINSKTKVIVNSCVKESNSDEYRLTMSAKLPQDLSVGDTIYYNGIAYGDYSHVEGEGTHASAKAAHAEGRQTQATQYAAHAEGEYTQAKGWASHAEGQGTVTSNPHEHAAGTYNLSTVGYTKSSFGIGTSDDLRKNAYEIDYDGNIYIKGIGGYDGTNYRASNVKSVQTVIAELVAALT